jgi:GAF domain-containing protein
VSDKQRIYETVRAQLASVLEECPDLTSAMACTAALLKQSFPHFSWVGFYRPDDDGALVVGPYQGPLACVRLPPGKGVCGEAARTGKPVVVPDVHQHAGHIACDPDTRSEIVVPLRLGDRLVAVLDVDSDRLDAFDETDRVNLAGLAAEIVHVSS